MRGWLLCLLLLGCRTRPFEEGGLAPADMGRTDIATPADMAHPPDAGCSPAVPNGYCPPGTTCCPFSCWGGNDVTGWCFQGPGCPVC